QCGLARSCASDGMFLAKASPPAVNRVRLTCPNLASPDGLQRPVGGWVAQECCCGRLDDQVGRSRAAARNLSVFRSAGRADQAHRGPAVDPRSEATASTCATTSTG
ncbi:MAG: hypothetical protein M1305_01455, partial [Candidatus Marsarchaeota archaeon]|nr:hypothetical protein [Candidatus Marsarchaeota archaeon]